MCSAIILGYTWLPVYSASSTKCRRMLHTLGLGEINLSLHFRVVSVGLPISPSTPSAHSHRRLLLIPSPPSPRASPPVASDSAICLDSLAAETTTRDHRSCPADGYPSTASTRAVAHHPPTPSSALSSFSHPALLPPHHSPHQVGALQRKGQEPAPSFPKYPPTPTHFHTTCFPTATSRPTHVNLPNCGGALGSI